MLVSAYIQSKLNKFGASIDANELESLLLLNSIAVDEVYSADNAEKASKALYSIIPELLAMPDITEGGFSMKFNREGILAYYSLLCKELGLENKLAVKQPKVKNKSYLW